MEAPNHEHPHANGPSLAEKAVYVSVAMTKWIRAGRPRTTPAEHAERERLCRACEFFDAEKLACKVCGCPGNPERLLFGAIEKPGKWQMATERCPLGTDRLREPYRSMKPRWLQTVPADADSTPG